MSNKSRKSVKTVCKQKLDLNQKVINLLKVEKSLEESDRN